MQANFNLHLNKEESLKVEVNIISGTRPLITLDIKLNGGYSGMIIYATAEQLWDALKDLDLSLIEPKNMLEEQTDDLIEKMRHKQIDIDMSVVDG